MEAQVIFDISVLMGLSCGGRSARDTSGPRSGSTAS